MKLVATAGNFESNTAATNLRTLLEQLHSISTHTGPRMPTHTCCVRDHLHRLWSYLHRRNYPPPDCQGCRLGTDKSTTHKRPTEYEEWVCPEFVTTKMS